MYFELFLIYYFPVNYLYSHHMNPIHSFKITNWKRSISYPRSCTWKNNLDYIPKVIEDACRRQTNEDPEHRGTMWLGWESAANNHATSKATGIASYISNPCLCWKAFWCDIPRFRHEQVRNDVYFKNKQAFTAAIKMFFCEKVPEMPDTLSSRLKDNFQRLKYASWRALGIRRGRHPHFFFYSSKKWTFIGIFTAYEKRYIHTALFKFIKFIKDRKSVV